MKYSLILLDPPWKYDNQQQNDPARGGITYNSMTMEQLYHLPLTNIASNDSMLVCWVTFPKLMDQYYEKYDPLAIIRNWGFKPLTALFIWIKTNKRGALTNDDTDLREYDDYYSGLGRYTNSNAEMAIVARRGKALERLDKSVKQLMIAPIGKHSAKPQEQYNRLHRLWGDVPRIELFARKDNPPPKGWDATGLEYDGVDIKDYLTKGH